MTQRRTVTLYLTGIAAVFIGLGATLWLPGLVLWRTGELWRANAVVENQLKHDGLWSTGLIQTEEEYKQSLYDRLSADVVAVGTSRVLQLRQPMFTQSFANMGRAFEMLRVDEELPELMKNRKPKLVLWGFDYWHFGTSRAAEQLGYRARERKTQGVAASGKVTPDILPRQIHQAWSLFLADPNKGGWIKAGLGLPLYPGYRMGLRAVLTNRGGYGADGSNYGFWVYERPDAAFREMMDSLKSATGIYQLKPDERVSQDLVNRARETIAALRRQNINVVIYMVPLPTRSNEIMRRPEYANYIAAGTKALAALAVETGSEYFDLLDGARAGIQDSEFMDHIHPGDVANARLLLHMAERSAALRAVLDQQALRETILYNANRPAARRAFYARFGVTAEK